MVQAHILNGGILIQPLKGNSCKIMCVDSIELGGSIPKPMVKYTERQSAYSLYHMSELLQKDKLNF